MICNFVVQKIYSETFFSIHCISTANVILRNTDRVTVATRTSVGRCVWPPASRCRHNKTSLSVNLTEWSRGLLAPTQSSRQMLLGSERICIISTGCKSTISLASRKPINFWELFVVRSVGIISPWHELGIK